MNYPALLRAITTAHEQAQAGAAGAVNRHLILRNWLIGAYLVEFEQRGADRAKYGERLLARLAADLEIKGVSGCSRQSLQRMRQFYLYYPQLRAEIRSPLVSRSDPIAPADRLAIRSPPVSKSSPKPGPRSPTPLPVDLLLRLSWTHLIDLLALDDPWKRAFYENECLNGKWSKRQLQRQIGSLLYERTGLSTDKAGTNPRGQAVRRSRERTRRRPDRVRPFANRSVSPSGGCHFRSLGDCDHRDHRREALPRPEASSQHSPFRL